MQVHLEAPQADLNAGGVGEEQDLYQPDIQQEDLLTSCFLYKLLKCLEKCSHLLVRVPEHGVLLRSALRPPLRNSPCEIENQC